MAFDAAGTFTRYGGSTIWQGDALAGTKILSDRHDAHDQEIANGLSECLTRSGKGAPTVDISWGSKRLINLGAPTADTDAATKVYVDTFKSFTTGSIITGADANGRVTFSSPTGTNGLSWTGADLTWLAKIATAAGPGTPPVPPATLNRLVLNDKADGSGTDVVEVRDDGSIKAGAITTTAITADSLTTTGNVAITGSVTVTAVTASGQVQGGSIKSLGNVYAGASFMGLDGNISGTATVWSNWGAQDAYTAISARIEARATAWANDRIANLQYRKVSEGAVGGLTTQGTYRVPGGAVMTGLQSGPNNTIPTMLFMYLQVYDPVRGWVGFSG